MTWRTKANSFQARVSRSVPMRGCEACHPWNHWVGPSAICSRCRFEDDVVVLDEGDGDESSSAVAARLFFSTRRTDPIHCRSIFPASSSSSSPPSFGCGGEEEEGRG